jgi:DNA-binding LacI/PurR family transcriptional regulator
MPPTTFDRPKARPTIKDIAGLCGVSEATVSYVINGKRKLRADTRERVERTMQELNYHPSAVARGLSSKRVHTLGILFGAVESIEFATNSYVNGLLQGIMQQAQEEGFDITFFTAQWKNAAVSAPPLSDGRTDGVLVISPRLDSDILEGLSSLGIPHVAISAVEKNGVANVDVDNFAGAKMATQHLLELGHRELAYLSGNEDLASSAPRRAGFLSALKHAELKPREEWVQTSNFDGSLAFEQARVLLQQTTAPTAIIAGNDHIAFGVLEAAQHFGIRVPQQLSIVGFDDVPAAQWVTPALTTIRQPLKEIGQTATQVLIESVRDKKNCIRTTRLMSPKLIIRGTTAPPVKAKN